MEVKRAVVESVDTELIHMLSRFILNAAIFTPKERYILIKLFEYLILPRYAPIEEDYRKTQVNLTGSNIL